MLLDDLKERIDAPSWLSHNCMFLTQMGSVAYGCSGESSDWDMYGFCIPPKNLVFPHLKGEIPGFGRQHERFDQWQQHHIDSEDGRRNYDFSVYSIVRFFHLCMENNPNMVDAMFVPTNMIVHITHVGNMVRDNRKMFLHKGCWHKFKGYAFQQLNKMKRKPIGKRAALVEKYGYDVKFAYHVVRLLNEVEQILEEGDLDLMRSREQLKSIRRGEWSEAQIRTHFDDRTKILEKLYADSKLPYGPDETEIKKLLLRCLKRHYGDLGPDAIVNPDAAVSDLHQIKAITDKWT